MNGTGAPPRSLPAGTQLARTAIRQTLWITGLAVLGYICIRSLPVDSGALHYSDFAAGEGGALEFCEPGGPQFVPVDRVRSPVTMGVRVAEPGSSLRSGAAARLLISLTASSGRPVTEQDLLVVHTQKLHLLAIDPSLDDYQHLHPQPTGVPGEFAVDFTPRRDGEYRLFADFTPRATGRALYAGARIVVEGGRAEARSASTVASARAEASPDLAAPAHDGARNGGGSAGAIASDPARRISSEPPVSGQAAAIDEPRTAVVEGYRFSLSLDRDPPRINETAELRLEVLALDGSPAALEEIMGARAHVVAFDRGRTGFAHLHPLVEPGALDTGSVGAEPLRFQLSLSDPGTYRLWAQVKIAGRELFAPFAVTVGP